jgi:hypothetical protein
MCQRHYSKRQIFRIPLRIARAKCVLSNSGQSQKIIAHPEGLARTSAADGRQTRFCGSPLNVCDHCRREVKRLKSSLNPRTLGRGSALALNPVRIPMSQIKNDCQNNDHHHKGRYCLHRLLLKLSAELSITCCLGLRLPMLYAEGSVIHRRPEAITCRASRAHFRGGACKIKYLLTPPHWLSIRIAVGHLLLSNIEQS